MGLNSYSQLGNGLSANTNLPIQVQNLVCASLGPSDRSYHSMAVAALLPQFSGPTNQYVPTGQSAVFSLSLTGGDGPFTYQWQFNGTNIDGATNSSYVIPAVASSDVGTYTGRVIGMGGTTASSANLAILLPAQNFGADVRTGTNGPWLHLQFNGTPNYPYILLSTTNLTPPTTWRPVTTNRTDGSGNWQFTDTNLNGGQKFYRAVSQ